ncbi:MAG: hypothetical protein LBQ66_01580 [Planctomycetaceae bacterium]|nr:hypothetical protein [Planctomycetaceae bacterium]
MGNRPLGGYVFGERSKPKTVGAENASVKPKRPTFWAIESPVRVGDPVVGLRRRNRPAVGCPPYDHQRINRPISSGASPRR